MLLDNFDSYRTDYRNHHGHGHSIILPFDPCRVAWKHHDVVYLDYLGLQSHNSESKRVVDTRTHRVGSFLHTSVHKNVHEKLNKVFHGMYDEKVHSLVYGDLHEVEHETI